MVGVSKVYFILFDQSTLSLVIKMPGVSVARAQEDTNTANGLILYGRRIQVHVHVSLTISVDLMNARQTAT